MRSTSRISDSFFKVDPRCVNTFPSWIVGPKSSVLIFRIAGMEETERRRAIVQPTLSKSPEEARKLLHAIEGNTLIGLYERALIGMTVYSVARGGARVTMNRRQLGCGCTRRRQAPRSPILS